MSSLASERAHIAELDSQILPMQHSLVALKNERKSVQARLDAYRYPILTVPNEIVSQFFVHTLPPTNMPTMAGYRATPREFRLALKRGAEVFETWVARSGSCPLAIQLKDARSSTASEVDLNRFAEIIVRHLSHIEHLELSISDKVDLSQLASLSAASSIPLLRTLKLGSWSAQDSVPIAHFLNAPLLRSVHITRSPSPSKLLLPWSQLPNLVLEGVSAPNIAMILRQTVNLVHLSLRIASPLDFPSDSVEPLTRLESLEIDSISSFSCLSLPALRTLKITCFTVEDLSRLDNDFSRWGCNLETLHVTAQCDSDPSGTSTREKCRERFPYIPTVLVDILW
ncbi:hypothetical protein C8R45DRAFT_1162795 [Mycena sanguinolenta]|nr:hypothetical protein C8R45DRAFT_1162795 [Mycena sanguinolenta]